MFEFYLVGGWESRVPLGNRISHLMGQMGEGMSRDRVGHSDRLAGISAVSDRSHERHLCEKSYT